MVWKKFIETVKFAKVLGHSRDGDVGRLPGSYGHLMFTTAEVENGVTKEVPMCETVEIGHEKRVIEILEIYDKEVTEWIDVKEGIEDATGTTDKPTKPARKTGRGPKGKKKK